MTLATGNRLHLRAARLAFTLLEVLLVLALLVVAAALAWPVLDRTFAGSRLRKSADLVRAVWSQARIDAMAYGRTHAFVCRGGTNEFNYDVWTGEDLMLDQAEHAPADDNLGNDRHLPQGLTFVSVEAVNAARGPQESDSGFKQKGATASFSADATAPAAGAKAAGPTLSPILFFADGTASDARLIIANDSGRQIAITLRGLTGVALVGEIEEGDPLKSGARP